MAYINYRKNNPSYSPGISTYGNTDSSVSQGGEKGPRGKDGTSIYFINATISDGVDEVNNLIREQSSFEDSESSEVVEYKVGDLVIDDSANVYRIEELEPATLGIDKNEKLGDFAAQLRQYFYAYKNSSNKWYIKLPNTDLASGIHYDLITKTGSVIYDVILTATNYIVYDASVWKYPNTSGSEIKFIQERDNNGNVLLFDVPKIS